MRRHLKRIRELSLLALLVAGVTVLFWPSASEDGERGELVEALDRGGPTAEAGSRPPRGDAEDVSTTDVDEQVPQAERQENAVPDERIYRFSSIEEMEAYLAALEQRGLSARGSLRGIPALRLSDRVARQLDPAQFGAEAEDNLYSARPFPVEELPAARLAGLRPFGQTAREMATLGERADGAGVIVAVLDNGIASDLEANHYPGSWLDYVGGDGEFAHGTAVASIIGGSSGVAPEATLLNIRVLDETGVGTSFELARGIVEATDRGAQVINMSLGVYGESRLLRDAIRYAADRGVLLVAAAGNEGRDQLPLPASDSRVLAVTAVDANRTHPGFPNQHREIDVAAPGVGILAAGSDGPEMFSGTSAAAPMVSGTLAALLSENPSAAPSTVVATMRQNLDDVGAPGADPMFGEGIVNWERLERRNRQNVVDLAIADIYLDPRAEPGQRVPVVVSVQNQGTAWLSGARLTVQVGMGPPAVVNLGSLDQGAVASHIVYADLPRPGSPPLDIVAVAEASGSQEDVNPANNVMSRRFFFAE